MGVVTDQQNRDSVIDAEIARNSSKINYALSFAGQLQLQKLYGAPYFSSIKRKRELLVTKWLVTFSLGFYLRLDIIYILSLNFLKSWVWSEKNRWSKTLREYPMVRVEFNCDLFVTS